jgi:hypothetical protein
MYAKDEGINLNFLTTTLIYIVPCKPLQLPQPFANICFGQVMSKVCQYVMNEAKVGVGMKEISLKDAQVDFQTQLPTLKNLERVDFVLRIPHGKCIWS